MVSIVKATLENAQLLTDIGKTTFIESHGRSASPADINSYVSLKYTLDAFEKELSDANNIYHIIYNDENPAGFSKIIYNTPHEEQAERNITKLERIYVLQEFYDRKLGRSLLEFNIELARENDQTGMWLYVWKENLRAFNFYKRNNFQIVGSYDFRISENHTNPNWLMLLEF